jgi:sigma-B regulation protein RsbU (phosphoserine phosphatase)
MLLYTDGLSESRNESDEEYGEERLTSLIRNQRSLSPPELIRSCLADVASFRGNAPRTDDLTLMVLRRMG